MDIFGIEDFIFLFSSFIILWSTLIFSFVFKYSSISNFVTLLLLPVPLILFNSLIDMFSLLAIALTKGE